MVQLSLSLFCKGTSCLPADIQRRIWLQAGFGLPCVQVPVDHMTSWAHPQRHDWWRFRVLMPAMFWLGRNPPRANNDYTEHHFLKYGTGADVQKTQEQLESDLDYYDEDHEYERY